MGAKSTLLELFNPAMVQSGEPVNGSLAIGQVAAAGATSTSSAAVTLAAGNSWIVAGMNVYDVTAGANVGTVSSYTAGGTSLTLSANASHAIATGDVLQFGFTPSDLAVGFAAGADVRGLVGEAIKACNEALAKLNYLSTDVITSSQDSAANTLIASAITSLS